jgi:hypothetical protein
MGEKESESASDPKFESDRESNMGEEESESTSDPKFTPVRFGVRSLLFPSSPLSVFYILYLPYLLLFLNHLLPPLELLMKRKKSTKLTMKKLFKWGIR